MGQTVLIAPLMVQWEHVLQAQRTARVMELGHMKRDDRAQIIQDFLEVRSLLRFGQLSLQDCIQGDAHRAALHAQLRLSQTGFLMNFAVDRRALVTAQRQGWQEFHDLVEETRMAILKVIRHGDSSLEGLTSESRRLLIELSSWLVRQVPPSS